MRILPLRKENLDDALLFRTETLEKADDALEASILDELAIEPAEMCTADAAGTNPKLSSEIDVDSFTDQSTSFYDRPDDDPEECLHQEQLDIRDKIEIAQAREKYCCLRFRQ